MRTLLVHPSGLMYSEIFLRLEPLGIERVAAASRASGHEVRLIDLQIFSHDDLNRELREFRPEAVGFGLNYLANVPEVIDLARLVKALSPGCFVFAGGHSVSFISGHVLAQADGAIDAIVRGEGEVVVPRCWTRRGTGTWTGCRAWSPRTGRPCTTHAEQHR